MAYHGGGSKPGGPQSKRLTPGGSPGRPKTQYCVVDWIKRELLDRPEDCQNIARAIIEAAKAGDHNAYIFLANRFDGPVTEKREVSGPDGQQLEQRIIILDNGRNPRN